jgi:putative hemolysin
MYSPGALNAQPGNTLGGVSSHADIAGNCKACHAAPWEADRMDDRCSTCHVDVAVEMKNPESVHGRMMQIDPQAQCRTCHPEHNGSDAVLTILEGWQFPHEVARFSLKGHPLTAEKEPFLCTDCHGKDVTRFDVLTCLNCHIRMDMEFMVEHQVTFGENCLECHDGVDRFGNDFDHNQFAFKLNGRHAAVQCSQCHVMATTVSALQATGQDCFSCHAKDDPHQGSLGTDCAACHSPDGWKPSSFDHNRSDFKLNGAHAQVTCEKCHINGVFKGTPRDCFSCHQQIDPHLGSLGTECAACHSPDGWKPSSFDHNRSDFKLNGAHAQVTCEKCHVNRVFKGTPIDCFSCHQQIDPHMGQFSTACEKCHTTDAWKPASFDHNTTSFTLTGSHINVDCKSCHINGIYKNTPKDCFSCHSAKDAHQGQFGRNCGACHQTTKWSGAKFDHNATAFPLIGNHVKLNCRSCHTNDVFKGTPTDCFSCHAKDDHHNGQFGQDCSICHIPTGWKNITFDHNSSAFPLTGKHALLDCSQCHFSGQFKIPTDCASCHVEPAFHAGALGTNCVQCHTTSGWSAAIFAGTHPVALGQNFLDHHGATCKTCHTTTVNQFTCLACHETNPLSPPDGTAIPTSTLVATSIPVSTETPIINEPNVLTSITPSNIQVGDTSQLTISLNNIPAQGYTSTEFTCMYNPAFVEVSNISVGNLFGSDAVSGISGPQNGSFILAVAGSNGRKASESGIVFSFNAKGLQAGQTNVECKARVSEGLHVLQSIGSLPSTMTIAGITPTVANMPTFASITGQVLASKLVTIRLYNPDNSIAATGTANPDGTFNITIPGGTYTIVASAEGFLGAQGSLTPVNGSIISMPAVRLIAGDLDNNGVINQLDALTIGMNYENATPAAADLNNDSVINVLDLGILAENFGKSGALPWP